MTQQIFSLGTGRNTHSGDNLPTVGTKLNANFTELYTVGAVQFINVNSTSLSINIGAGQYVVLNMNSTVSTMAISGWTSNALSRCILEVRNTGSFDINNWAGAKWVEGNTPVLSHGAGKIDLFSLTTSDAGNTIIGNVVGKNYY